MREVGRQTHRDYLPSLSRSLSEDFQDYIVGTRENTVPEEVRKIRGTRRGKKAHVTRLVNQINRHISKQLSKETLASLKLDLEKAVSQLENINQALFELNPHDDEPEHWMEDTLAPVYDCFENIEMYHTERVMLDAKLVKEVDEMLVPDSLKSSKENVDKSFSHDNSKSVAPVVQTSDVQISLPPTHEPVKIGTSPVMELPITTVENSVPNTTRTSNSTVVPATSCTTPKVPLTHPGAVTTVTNSICPPVSCYKPSFNPGQISTPATQNSPWRGWTTPNHVLSDIKQTSTPASQNSPWRGWTVPNHALSPRPSSSGTSLQPHPRWGLMPDFPGPPPDAWIDQLDEYGIASQPQLTAHHHCSFSAMERSLPKFDLGNLMAHPLPGLRGLEDLKVSCMISPF